MCNLLFLDSLRICQISRSWVSSSSSSDIRTPLVHKSALSCWVWYWSWMSSEEQFYSAGDLSRLEWNWGWWSSIDCWGFGIQFFTVEVLFLGQWNLLEKPSAHWSSTWWLQESSKAECSPLDVFLYWSLESRAALNLWLSHVCLLLLSLAKD